MSAKEHKEVNVLCTISHGTGLYAMLCYAMLCYSSRQLLLKDEKVVCLVSDLSSLMCVLGVFQGSEVDEQHFPSRWAMCGAPELFSTSLWTRCSSVSFPQWNIKRLIRFSGHFMDQFSFSR